MFVFIYPYPDENARIARFILNTQLVTAGYPWTVIRPEKRNQYMTALECLSVDGNIKPDTTRNEYRLDKGLNMNTAPLKTYA